MLGSDPEAACFFFLSTVAQPLLEELWSQQLWTIGLLSYWKLTPPITAHRAATEPNRNITL